MQPEEWAVGLTANLRCVHESLRHPPQGIQLKTYGWASQVRTCTAAENQTNSFSVKRPSLVSGWALRESRETIL